ncbi:MAG TPA: carboxypeptidase regulatory-like domain-containing protein [Vicinamibacterales bacterium]|nr:carboxypeptidase regulatory-like domain-containing protein [Vicinamibacterales bacterium]
MRRARSCASAAGAAALLAVFIYPIGAQQAPAPCAVKGRATSGGTPLPGVSLVAFSGETVTGATSTDADGTYRLLLPPGSFRLTAELTGFQPIERELTLGEPPCDHVADLVFVLAPRSRPTSAAAPPGQGSEAQRGAPPTGPTAPGPAGRGSRFETLAVQTQATAAAGLEVNPPDREAVEATRLLLPPGFSADTPTEAVAITGNMASLDRGMMADRLGAIARGEFDPVTGQFAQGFGPEGAEGQFGGRGGRGGPGGRGGRGGGRGADFVIGGRGGRQGTFNAQATYSFSGSALDSAPYQLRPDSPADKQPYTRQNFGGTIGGPLRIPGVYNGGRRTTFMLNYGGNRGGDLFDQYATVPLEAMRGGDFSSSPVPLVDPATGLPFPDNRIPQDRMSPSALALLRFIPLPNVPGTARNFHHTTTRDTSSDNMSLRVTHSFTEVAAGGRGGFGRGGGRGGRGGGRGNQGTSVMMNAQLQYRNSDGEQINVLPLLGGATAGSSLSVPVTLNIAHRRQLHNVNVTFSRTSSNALNRYSFVEDVAGGAGIFGVARDPFDWGVPQLSFSSLSSVRDVTPALRKDGRFSVGYTWTRPMARHTLRFGGDFRLDRSRSRTDADANGAFVFTGLYSSDGRGVPRGAGLDFADFLLGLPQQTSLQYGPGIVDLSGRSMSLFVQDDWRRSAGLTFNLGVRYELLWPFVEENGHMVNLDAAEGFSAVAPVPSGGTGPYTGPYPAALVRTDPNNVAPRVGIAWRVAPGMVVRGGYGISFNSGSYSSIARQLVGQPPFAVANTGVGTLESPLSLSNPLANAAPADTRNTYGIDKDYDLGVVQTWNADFSRDLGQAWNAGASYVHTRGSSLDIVRAPNRGPDGVMLDGVQPFLWQSSEAASVLHAAAFRVRRRLVNGIGAGFSYTLARSRDNASTIGGGGTVVAQDDRNLDAEWGLSSFDRRHQFSADMNVELPFGENRPWLNQGGIWAALLSNWRVTSTFTWQSGTPYTPRVVGAASDVARGTNGTLRADYDGQRVAVADPTIDRFFNTAAFSVPAPGLFGTASRNMIIGPGSRLLNAQLARDLRMGGNRVISFQLNATNLLNMVNYAAIDTAVNSPTFGQVLSVRPMRSVQAGVRFRF